MRVVIAAGIFPPDIGGPATYAEQIADALVASGHRVMVLCYGSLPSGDEKRTYPVYRVSRTLPKILTFAWYLFSLVKLSRSADVVFAQGPTAGGMQALAVRRIFGTPYVVKVTGDYAWEQGSGRYNLTSSIDAFQKHDGTMPLMIRLLEKTQRLVSVSAAQVIVPSEYLKSMVMHWGVASDRVSVIYNAAPAESDRDQGSERSIETVSHPLVLSIGRLVPWKGFDTLIEAWPDIVEKYPSARLGIIGAGPDEGRLRSLVAGSSAAESISVVGQQGRAELSAWYRQSDIFILNSGYEGLSHAILEAQSNGIPCAVSDTGGNPELVEHEKTGLLFPYNNRPAITASLLRLLDSPQQARKFAHAAGLRMHLFSREAMIEKTLAILKKAAERESQ